MLNDIKSARRAAPEFLQGLIDTLTQRGRAVLGMKPERGAGQDHDLEVLGEALRRMLAFAELQGVPRRSLIIDVDAVHRENW